MDLPLRALLVGIGWCVGWWLLWRVRTVSLLNDSIGRLRKLRLLLRRSAKPPPPRFVPAPRVSVVVPARDEEHSLPTLLAALAVQTEPAAEIVVVDDHSTDGTRSVAASAGARVIGAEPLPDGWTGKTWAMWQGARAAEHDVVVLLDADVEPSPFLLARLGACFARVQGLLSVQPYHRVRRWWERASAFFNVVAVMGVGIASPRPPRRPSAFGACMMCRRDAFLEHCAHPSVRSEVLEDVALARRFAVAGEPVMTFGGRDLVAFRMYDTPVRLIEGWTKGFAAGAGSISPVRLVLIVAWVAACLSAGWGVLDGSVLAIALYAAFALQLFVMQRQVGSFGVVTALLYPVLAAVFVALFAWSLVLAARGEVRWKGRTIRIRGARGT